MVAVTTRLPGVVVSKHHRSNTTQHAIDTWKTKKASAHWIVPDENEPQHENFVWAVVGEAKAAFHAGLVFWTEMRDKGMAPGIEGDAPDRLAREIAKCDAALARLK